MGHPRPPGRAARPPPGSRALKPPSRVPGSGHVGAASRVPWRSRSLQHGVRGENVGGGRADWCDGGDRHTACVTRGPRGPLPARLSRVCESRRGAAGA